MQEYVFLRATRRAGVEPSKSLDPATLAVLCPACPQPDINMDPNWRHREEDKKCVHVYH